LNRTCSPSLSNSQWMSGGNPGSVRVLEFGSAARGGWPPVTWPLLVCVCIAAPTIGCGRSPKVAAPDPVKARETLIAVLDGWKEGQAPDSFQQLTPPVHVLDGDWMHGGKLTDYMIAGEGEVAHNNYAIPVKISLQNARGLRSERTVTYLVSTSPTLSVMRELVP
jgi:hypothetical protein